MAEVGIFGFAGFLCIIFSLFEGVWKKTRQDLRNRQKHGTLIFGLLCGVFAFLIQSFLDTNLYSLQLVIYLWVAIGLLVGGVKSLNNAPNYDIKMT
jgi:O-antigen ligase